MLTLSRGANQMIPLQTEISAWLVTDLMEDFAVLNGIWDEVLNPLSGKVLRHCLEMGQEDLTFLQGRLSTAFILS